ncbi:MAG TPA: iron-sulfur cluster assembly scaffold protein [Chitinispirillaceae bacterium]|nr:iron-sulfur cluster assembly scaffold protein [Chitinispirillaceae bacterium]
MGICFEKSLKNGDASMTSGNHQNSNLSDKPQNMKRMNDPDGAAFITGLCGDTMEIYLEVKNGTVKDATFFTDGCESSILCGSTTASLAKGKSLDEILKISPSDIIKTCGNIPQDHIHCTILAVSTLHKALADYLLKKQYG